MAEKRSAFFLFMQLNKDNDAGSPSWALVGDGVTELTISYNPQTTTSQYIHQDSGVTNVTGYQPNAPVTAEAVKDDGVFMFINMMRKTLPIGSEAHTHIAMVDIFDGSASRTHTAIKQKVAIQIDSYGGAASDPLSIGYTINWIGEGEQGTFNLDTLEFTSGTAAPASYGGDLEV